MTPNEFVAWLMGYFNFKDTKDITKKHSHLTKDQLNDILRALAQVQLRK